MSPHQRRSRSSSGARACGSTTRTASATSTGCPACSPARSATAAPSWPRRRPARPAPWPTSRSGATPTRWRWSWPTGWPSSPPATATAIFFTTGGSEAVESAWKLARQYFRVTGQPDRLKVISRNIAYHGATMGALSITGLADIKTAVRAPGARSHQGAQHQLLPGPVLRRRPRGLRPVGGRRHRAGHPDRGARARWPPCSSSRSRTPGAASRRLPGTSNGCARSATATACCWCPTR